MPLDCALCATPRVRGGDVRVSVRDSGTDSNAPYAVRYAIGTPGAPVVEAFDPRRHPASTLTAMFVIICVHSPRLLCAHARGRRLLRAAAVNGAFLSTGKAEFLKAGMWRALVRRVGGKWDVVADLAPAASDEEILTDPFTGDPCVDQRHPLPTPVAQEALKVGAVEFSQLPSINRNDPAMWSCLAQDSLRVLRHVDERALARQAGTDENPGEWRAMLQSLVAKEVIAGRDTYRRVPLFIRKQVGFVTSMLEAMPRSSRQRGQVLSAMPKNIRAHPDILRVAFGHGGDEGWREEGPRRGRRKRVRGL